jgi:outer membrane protein
MHVNCARMCVGVLCVLAVTARAQTSPYTLDRCVALGLERSAAALNARRDREIGRTLIKQARAEAFPTLSGVATYTRLDEVQDIGFGAETFSFGVLDNYSVLGKVEQLLYSGGRVRAAMHAAGLAREFYDRGAAYTESLVTRDIRTGFHGILLAREVVVVRREAVAQFEVHAAEAVQKAHAGTVSEYDQLSAQVRVANERPALIVAQKDLRLARLNLRRLLNVEDRDFAVDGALVYTPVDRTLADLLPLAVESRTDVQQMELDVMLGEQEVNVARSGQRPSLRAFFAYNGANAYEFVEYEDAWEWHWNAGVVAEWTFWDGGLTSGKVRQKQLELTKSQTSLDDLTRIVRMQVQAAYIEMERAREAIEAGGGSVRLAEKALSIADKRFGAGLATNLEYTDSQLALSTSRLTRLQALHDHMNAVAELEYVCGLPYGALDAGKAQHEGPRRGRGKHEGQDNE